MMSKAKLLVIGIGQALRGDDGAGLEVVKRWQADYPEVANNPDVVIELAPLPGLSLLSFLECVETAILVDAVKSGAKAGSVHVLDRAELASFGSDAHSAHGWGVAETLALGENLYGDKLPEQIYLLAIEAGTVEMGSGLSPAVAEALPAAAKRLQQLVDQAMRAVSSAKQEQLLPS
jgi:hydrogenase maturation protease